MVFFFFTWQGQILPSPPPVKMQQPPSGPTGRGQIVNRVSSSALAGAPAEGAPSDSLIGRKVRTRWPDDNNFYEAVITDHNPVEVCICFILLSKSSGLCIRCRFNVLLVIPHCIFLIHFQGRHALVYDIGTANETWEWVNLAEVHMESLNGTVLSIYTFLLSFTAEISLFLFFIFMNETIT